MKFSDVIEAIKELSTEEKQEIQMLLEQCLQEDIYENFQAAKQEEQNSQLTFSSSINELKQLIED